MAVVSTGQARNRRSVCDLITGRVPVHTQAKPAVDMSSLSGRTSVRRRPRSPMDRRVPSFVLNAQALLPFRRLLLTLTLLLAAYYWFQVYTTTVSSDINAFLGEGSNYTFLSAWRWRRVGAVVEGEAGAGKRRGATVATVEAHPRSLFVFPLQRCSSTTLPSSCSAKPCVPLLPVMR